MRLTIQLVPPVIEELPAVIVRLQLPATDRWLWRALTFDPLNDWGWARRWWPRPTEPIVRSYHAGPFHLLCGLR